MSDSAGMGRLSDKTRIDRFDPDALFGPGFEKNDDGTWSPAVARALYVNADGAIELRTDGTTLVQEPGSPITMKAPVSPAVTKSIAAVSTAATAGVARLTSALATTNATVAANAAADDARLDALEAADVALDVRVTALEAAPAGAGNACDAVVDFGSTFTHFASVVVTGQTWVTATSRINATVTATDVEEAALMQFSTVISARAIGVGFTLSVYTPIEAKGTYTFACIGV